MNSLALAKVCNVLGKEVVSIQMLHMCKMLRWHLMAYVGTSNAYWSIIYSNICVHIQKKLFVIIHWFMTQTWLQ